MTFNRCTFTECTSSSNGGAGTVSGGLLLVQDSVFENNAATLTGGAIHSSGTSMTDLQLTATAMNLKGVVFYSNTAESGGAIQLGTGSMLTMRDSTLEVNKVNYGGLDGGGRG